MKFIFFCLFILLFSNHLQAQQLQKTYTIKLKDGATIIGKVLTFNKEYWEVENDNVGILKIATSQIESFVSLDGTDSSIKKNDIILRDTINPVPERYLFMPSAFNLESMSASFSSSYFLFNKVDLGILKNWSVGFGGFTPIVPVLVTVNTKISFKIKEKLHMGVQGDWIKNVIVKPHGHAFVVQGMVTFGDRKKNTTFNVGRFFDKDLQDVDGTWAGFSHTFPISWRTFFITQNQIFIFNDGFKLINPSLCFRLVRTKKLYDIGLTGLVAQEPSGITYFLPLPYIGYQFTSSRRK